MLSGQSDFSSGASEYFKYYSAKNYFDKKNNNKNLIPA